MFEQHFAIFLGVTIVAIGATQVFRRYARRANLLDIPNERSSHESVTPRGGGVCIVVLFLLAVGYLHFVGGMPTSVFWALVVGAVSVAGVGFADDHSDVSALLRFLIQSAAATFAITMLGGLPEIQLGEYRVDLGLPGDVLSVVFTVWLINLYNFMDGIDGIAAVESVCITGGALAILPYGESMFFTTLLVVHLAATLGFLCWNWPPAKIFMGDVGSGFIGFVLAMFAIISCSLELLSIWVWLILAGVFIVDATITLVTRAIYGESLHQAHNNHAYQKLARRFNKHLPVTLGVLVINLFWLLPLAWLASTWPEQGWLTTLVAWFPLVALSLVLGSGRPDAIIVSGR